MSEIQQPPRPQLVRVADLLDERRLEVERAGTRRERGIFADFYTTGMAEGARSIFDPANASSTGWVKEWSLGRRFTGLIRGSSRQRGGERRGSRARAPIADLLPRE